jgi:hypothetical protein
LSIVIGNIAIKLASIGWTILAGGRISDERRLLYCDICSKYMFLEKILMLIKPEYNNICEPISS